MLGLLSPAAAQGAWTGVGAGAPARIAPDRIEIRLAPKAAREARRSPAVDLTSGRRMRHARLGVAALDALAARAPGLTFEREFRGEVPPPAGSGDTDFTAFYRVRLPLRLSVDQALAAFRAMPEVESADPIAILQAAAFPNDSLWSASTWFYQPSRFDVHAPEAWDVTTGDPAIVVAILDTGVLPYHPDLETQIWTNAAEAAGAPGEDDDGNGYIDDAHGWDFVDLVAGDQVTPGEDWKDEDADPNDFSGHGTKVAGIVGAATDNTIGVAGTAWRVRLMPLRVMWSENGATNGVVDMSYVAEALLYAARMGASVANCSFETANQGGLLAAASAAIRAGVTIVCAAGNGGTPYHALADREDVLAVGATTSGDVVAAFSNTGSYVDLCAPGVGVHSTYVLHAGPDSVSRRQPGYNAALNGTSFSAPFASGAVALVQSHRRSLGLPPLEPIEMVFRLRETADDITAQNPGGADYGTGRLNLHRALIDTETSTAFRTRARSIGPAVVIPTRSGPARTAFVTNGNRLVIVSGTAADTIVDVVLPGRPARQLAAADLGAGTGIGLFTGTMNGKVTGHDGNGGVLPGWPVNGLSSFVSMIGGPALGDLDGDGTIEIVCGADDGSLYAWHRDGSRVTGFPVVPFTSGFSGAVALADLDGQPGAEIVGLSRTGDLIAVRWDASVLAGWPQFTEFSTTTISPVVAKLGDGPEPAILVPLAGGVRAYRPSGAVRFSVTGLGGNVTFDPATGDLDGDGRDEILLPLGNATLAALDSAGAQRPGWPVALGGASQGPPVIGPLRAGGEPGVLVFRAGTLLGFDGTGQRLATFPKPGAAGSHPTIAEMDGDGHSEVAAGTGPDSVFYLYDAGPGTWSPSGSAWPTPRGNAARTGSRSYSPALPAFDDLAPGTIVDLALDSIGRTEVGLRWTASGNDGLAGRAARYELQIATLRSEAGTFATGVRTDLAAPDTSGSAQSHLVSGLKPGTTYFFTLRARDEAGNASASSEVLEVTTPLGADPPNQEPIAGSLRARVQPARPPVELVWRGARGSKGEAHVIRLFDLGGRRVRTIAVGTDSAGVVQWDGRGHDGRGVPAGLYFGRLESGGAHAETRIVLVP